MVVVEETEVSASLLGASVVVEDFAVHDDRGDERRTPYRAGRIAADLGLGRPPAPECSLDAGEAQRVRRQPGVDDPGGQQDDQSGEQDGQAGRGDSPGVPHALVRSSVTAALIRPGLLDELCEKLADWTCSP